MKEQPTRYELQVIQEIQEQTPKKNKGIFGNLLDNLNSSLNKAAKWVGTIPGIEKILQQVQEKSLNTFQDVSKWSVNAKQVMEQYAQAGYPQIQSPSDINALTLDEVEQIVGGLRKKYQLLCGDAQEEESQSASDIIALISLNQQAISEFATAYGFDINLQQERLFALNIMEYAAADDETTRQAVLSRMLKMAYDVAKKGEGNKETISKTTFIDTLRTMSSSITIRLLKAKVGEVIPITGAVIGGGFNAYFTHEVCDIAQLLYRKRFLLEKYGEDVFDLIEEDTDKKKDDGTSS